jgi:hypothetical protein
VDFENSIIVEATDKSIKNLERILLSNIPETDGKIYEGKDGYTEIRDMMYLESCLEDINYFKDRLKLKVKSISKEDIYIDNNITYVNNVAKKDAKRYLDKEKKRLKRLEKQKDKNTKSLTDFIRNYKRFLSESNPEISIDEDSYIGTCKLVFHIDSKSEGSHIFDYLSHPLEHKNTWFTIGCQHMSYQYNSEDYLNCEISIMNPYERYEEFRNYTDMDISIEEKELIKEAITLINDGR